MRLRPSATRTGGIVSGNWLNVIGVWLIVSGLAFFAIPVIGWVHYYRCASWVKTPAQVSNLQLKESAGEGKKSWFIEARYSWSVNGRDFSGKDVTPDDMWSDDPDFWPEIYKQIQTSEADQQAHNILVNPNAPNEAIIVRVPPSSSQTWVWLTGMGLLALGAVCFWQPYSMVRLRNQRVEEGKPWKADFPGFSIRSEMANFVSWGWLATLPTFPVSIGCVDLITDSREGIPWRGFGVLMLVACLWLLARALYRTAQALKYGWPTLELSQMPIVPGREFSGAIRSRTLISSESGLTITVTCEESHYANRQMVTRCLYSESKIFKVGLSQGSGSLSPFSWLIPESSCNRDPDSDTTYSWNLHAEAETPGIDFSADFDLPVYHVPASAIETRPA